MNKPDSTPVAAIVLIIVLGVFVVACLVGGLLFGAGWFLYRAQPIQVPPAVEIQSDDLELEINAKPTEESSRAQVLVTLEDLSDAIESNPGDHKA